MKYNIYDRKSGRFTSAVSNTDMIFDRPYVPGDIDTESNYVKDGEIRPLPSCPGPRDDYDWDLETEYWKFNRVRAIGNAKAKRKQLLAAVDRVNILWYNSLSDAQQAQLIAYRQALLDITKQIGYPQDISWPTKPAWL